MRHLILGGGGFIGRHVASQLTQAGEDVTLAGRRPPADSISTGSPLPFIRFHLADVDWPKLIGGFDIIHHYAWDSVPQTATDDPVADLDAHVRSSLSLLEAARRLGGKRLIFSSSGGTVYGPLTSATASEDDPLHPIGAYGTSKLTVESYMGVYHRSRWVDGRIARLSNPYGPGQDGARNQGLVSIFARKALTGEPLTIFGDGEIVRDYVHVTDVASALCRLSLAEPDGDAVPIFNVGSGRGASINEVVSILQKQLGRRLDVRYAPARAFDVPVSVLNIDRARAVLGWTPQTSLEVGVARLLVQLSAEATPVSAQETRVVGL